MKRFKKAALFLTAMILSIILGIVIYLTNGLNHTIQLNGISSTHIKDGYYIGNYNEKRWSVQVVVLINNNAITDIQIEDDVTFSQPGLSEALFEQVIKNQSTSVDIQSGATKTSTAYLKAIENALNNQ